jgi:dihydroorotate dehydrogenase electron transfer subunit
MSSGHDPHGAAVAPAGAGHRVVTIRANDRIARDTFLLRLHDPETARAILPGRFVMVRPAVGTDPLLGRPFALYDIGRDDDGAPSEVAIVYQVVGKGTAWLASRRAGEPVATWGPLGNGFGPPPAGPVVCVAGGIGQTPFLALGRWWLGGEAYGDGPIGDSRYATSVDVLYGVRSAEYLAGVDDFRRAGMTVEVATDDGSAGHHGFVTDLLARRLEGEDRPALVVACGPPAMLAATCRLLRAHGVPGLVSLENHMACGFGACFSCVAPIRQPDGSTDLRRVCVEGPVFDAADVVFA